MQSRILPLLEDIARFGRICMVWLVQPMIEYVDRLKQGREHTMTFLQRRFSMEQRKRVHLLTVVTRWAAMRKMAKSEELEREGNSKDLEPLGDVGNRPPCPVSWGF